MRYLWLVWLATVLNGCIPYSDNPLTAPDKEGPDPAILGTWFVQEEGETVFLHMGVDEKTKGLRVVMVEFHKEGEVKTSELIGHTSRLENNTYMNLRWDRPADPEEAGYLFVKYQVAGERIGLGLVRSDAVEKAIREGRIRGRIKDKQTSASLRLTDSSEKLREFVQEHDAVLFEELKWMNRLDLSKGPAGASIENDREVIAIEQQELSETVYSLGDESCELSLTAYESGPNLGVVVVRSKCDASWQRQLSLLEKGLARVLEDEKQARVFRALSWGRLAPDQRVPHEMSYRLALAAFESPLWDKKRGREKRGFKNDCVVELANKANIYKELKLIFAAMNRSVRFSSAEKVLVMEAGKLPFFDALKTHGVKAKDRLPFDCQAWFSVSGPLQ
ncbi:MAG: hypothetical protein HY881_13980 [Deltaproteobacteria bacterium]|nr:hypothetical protein [Deltaproteobacteria bacterium]